MDNRVPDWLLERYALGELPPERLEAVRARVAADPELAARLEALRADDAAFLAAWPPRRVVPGLEQRAARRAKVWWAFPGLALAAAVVVSVRVLSVPAVVDPPAVAEDLALELTRVKGADPALRVYRAEAKGAARLAENAEARPGDLLRLAVVGPADRWAAVVSIDGNGVVTRHGGPEALDLPGGGVLLPNAYELDDAPAFERFVLVTAPTPFATDTVVTAAKAAAAQDPRGGALALPAGYTQTSFALVKEPR